MDRQQLAEILRLHSLWLASDPAGVRADLRVDDLIKLNLSRANLSGAGHTLYADLGKTASVCKHERIVNVGFNSVRNHCLDCDKPV